MNLNLKLVLLALLGFSPACSTVKTSRSATGQNTSDTMIVRSDTLRQMIRVMYGVRPPIPMQEEEDRQQPDSLAADSAAVVVGYSRSLRRIMVAYGVRSPERDQQQAEHMKRLSDVQAVDSIADKTDSMRGINCVMPPAPKDSEQ